MHLGGKGGGLCGGVRKRPSTEPPKKPPIALLYESFFSRRFAAATREKPYAPPIAAVHTSVNPDISFEALI